MINAPSSSIWVRLEPVLAAAQRSGQLPPVGSSGWIGPIQSPLRKDDNPSFSVLPDLHGPGGFKDHATGQKGSMRNLARLLDVDVPCSRGQNTSSKSSAEHWQRWAKARRLDAEVIEQAFGARPDERSSRPSVIFPTELGVARRRYLDQESPKCRWKEKGGVAHWYGLEQAQQILPKNGGSLFVVNGEPSVWACFQSGVAAVCTAAGESGIPRDFTPVRALGVPMVVVYDLDWTGQKGAHNLVERLKEEGISARAVLLPLDLGQHGDVDDLHRKVGDGGLRAHLARLPKSTEGTYPLHLAQLRWRVLDCLPDAPISDTVLVPDGYIISKTGIWKLEHGKDNVPYGKRIAHGPLLLRRLLVDITDEHQSYEVLVLRQNEWKEVLVEREHLVTSRSITSIARWGAPVDSNRAPAMVEYVTKTEAVNRSSMPARSISARLGWQGTGGDRGFLWGNNWITPDGRMMSPSEPDETTNAVFFHAETSGEAQLAAACRSSGTTQGWVQTAALLRPYPRAMLAVYAALAAPLLIILDAPNFVIDWSNATSTGKTTILRGAASCWGIPIENRESSMLGTWDTTRVWMERSAALLHSLPLILDDTKHAKDKRAVAQTIYGITSGRGRSRGTKRGLDYTRSYRTILMLTGETPATSFSQDGGTRARVLTLWGPPFGVTTEETASLVKRLYMGFQSHYGHAGPAFVRQLLRHRKRWPALRKLHRSIHEKYLELAGSDPVASRMAEYAATLELAARLVHSILPLPWKYDDVIARLWPTMTGEAAEADRAAVALQHVMSWAYSNQSAFHERAETLADGSARIPPGGMAGIWEHHDWSSIAFFRHRLDDILATRRFEIEGILRLWRGRGWLQLDRDEKRFTKQIRRGGERLRLIVIEKSAVEEVECFDGDTGDMSGDTKVAEQASIDGEPTQDSHQSPTVYDGS